MKQVMNFNKELKDQGKKEEFLQNIDLQEIKEEEYASESESHSQTQSRASRRSVGPAEIQPIAAAESDPENDLGSLIDITSEPSEISNFSENPYFEVGIGASQISLSCDKCESKAVILSLKITQAKNLEGQLEALGYSVSCTTDQDQAIKQAQQNFASLCQDCLRARKLVIFADSYFIRDKSIQEPLDKALQAQLGPGGGMEIHKILFGVGRKQRYGMFIVIDFNENASTLKSILEI